MSETSAAFLKFVDVIAKLRDPDDGCPWDLKQTHASLKPYFVEETYEAIEAIDNADDKELCKELGDVLLQIVLHAQIAKERGAFDIADVCTEVSEKMIRRHPHVFADVKVSGAADVLQNWEEIKKQEKGDSPKKPHSVLDGVTKSLPALLLAERFGERASHIKFDWPNAVAVWEKIEEEIQELKDEVQQLKDKPEVDAELKMRLEHEIGDVLFSVTQLARKLDLSAEDCLRVGCERFQGRFQRMEQNAEKTIAEHSFEELEELWELSKQQS